jgi:hypothetical protein
VKTLEYKIKNLVFCIKKLCPWGFKFGILGFKEKKRKKPSHAKKIYPEIMKYSSKEAVL